MSRLAACLKSEARVLSLEGQRRASIALVLRRQRGVEQMLFIKRTVNPKDPWSGNVALPGGRREASDDDDEACAARECLEEVGVDLSDARRWRPLGRVADDRAVHAGRKSLVLRGAGHGDFSAPSHLGRSQSSQITTESQTTSRGPDLKGRCLSTR